MPIINTDKKRALVTNLIFRKEFILKQHIFFDRTGNSKYGKVYRKTSLSSGMAIVPIPKIQYR